jgi:FlaG/FlaF family flagellin (archaellin)
MADRVIIAWNFRNWITITLMAAIGVAVTGLVVSFIKGNLPSVSGNSPQSQTQPTGATGS